MEYKILSGADEYLVPTVQHLMKEGWEPQGGVIMLRDSSAMSQTERIFAQAMIRRTDADRKEG
jgi:hypothetical protein